MKIGGLMRDGKTKIVVRISDGLGNQLFQFALGKYLADKLGCEMVFDKTHFMLSRYRRFLLDKFLGPNKIKRWGFFKELLFIPLWCVKVKFGDNVFRKVLKFLGIKWLKVRSPFLFQDEFSGDIALDGERTIYISGCYGHLPHMPTREMMRQQLEVLVKNAESDRLYGEGMKSTESVSVHIRRSDYLLASNGGPALDVCYQRRAMKEILEKLKTPKWFFFSDDIEWCRKEFSDFENAVFVSGNEDAPYEDIRLMSLCKHHIIANSTFSWWGAYLGDDSGMTISPRPWFKGLEMPSSCVPSKWVAVSSE